MRPLDRVLIPNLYLGIATQNKKVSNTISTLKALNFSEMAKMSTMAFSVVDTVAR